MQPHTMTVHEIFEKERLHVVPLFQRPYVWSQDDQWAPLWDDIETQAQNCLESFDRTGEIQTSHFLGAIVVDSAKVYGRGVARANVIDGQQRLTTLQIFLAALRDVAEKYSEEDAEAVRVLTQNRVSGSDYEQRFKVWPTNSDRQAFAAVMTAGSPEALRDLLDDQITQGKLPQLARAYEFFHRTITSFLENDEDSLPAVREADHAQRVYAIIHALRTAVSLVVIQLEENDDPQIIFETLNARGQPLMPSDLIRNTIFLEASRRKLNGEDLYTRYWSHFDTTPSAANDDHRLFWHAMESQGRLYRPRIDLFFYHDLVLRTERVLNISHLFRTFREWRSRAALDTETYLASLERRSKNFAQLVNPAGTDRLGVFAKRLKALETSTVYPILLWMMERSPSQLSEESRDRIVSDLESYLVRRFVGGYTPKNYNNFFIGLLRRLSSDHDTSMQPQDVVREYLLEGEGPTNIWPSDSAFLHGWLNRPIYYKTKPFRAAMVLRALNDGMRTSRSEAMTPPSDLTVEHLMPQKWEAHYPFSDELPEPENEETLVNRRQRLCDTIGNLTLLTSSLNSSVGNAAIGKRVAKIRDDSDLRLNAHFRDGVFEQWDERDIEQRGRRLFEVATEIWPKPAAPVTDIDEQT